MINILVYGVGKLGIELLRGLVNRNINLYHDSYNGPGEDEYIFDYNNQIVNIINSSKLKNNLSNENLKESVSYIIVTLTGGVLEKEIDFLLELKIPLIILSTKFDEELVARKAKKAGVKILMSQNMALGIVDFWDRIEKIENIPKTIGAKISVTESHQSEKIDISGSAIKALKLFENKGCLVKYPNEGDFEVGKDGYSGSVFWIREKGTQIKNGVPNNYLSGHGYHKFTLYSEVFDPAFMENLFRSFSSLENYSIPGIFEINISYEKKRLIIIHNINGRDIYTDGVVKSIQFLENADCGVYSAIDVINSIGSE